MNLIIDIGNTRTKTALFDGENIIDRRCWNVFGVSEAKELLKLLGEFPIEKVAISSTKRSDEELERYLKSKISVVLFVRGDTPAPLNNLYDTPQTLGSDRLAGVVGATKLYPQRNILVVDIGTAMTFDVVTAQGDYVGGNISLGPKLRLEALNSSTDNLPMIDIENYACSELGKSTKEAIGNGVMNGIFYEIEGYITQIYEKYDDLMVIFTGGGTFYFEKRLKYPIFASSDLVNVGLNEILNYNED